MWGWACEVGRCPKDCPTKVPDVSGDGPTTYVCRPHAGQLVMAAGLAGLCLAPAHASALLIAALIIPVGVGGSFTVPPMTALLLDSVPADRADTASGVPEHLPPGRRVPGRSGLRRRRRHPGQFPARPARQLPDRSGTAGRYCGGQHDPSPGYPLISLTTY